MKEQFLRNEMLWGWEGQERLAAAHVIVFGLGGVGSYAAECLARAGVGELTLVDSDTVSVTNLNRQLEALWSTVGQPKAEAAAARIRDIHPEAVLHPVYGLYDGAHREDFFPAGCRYDYIVDAIDLVSCKLDLAETARRLDIPLIMALGTGNKLDPTLLRAADISETYGCPLARVMRKELRNRGILHQKVVFSPEQAAPARQLEAPPPGRRSVPASNPWLPAAAGLLLGSVVVRDILKQKERDPLC
nr:tRNA threonylcarbamoyladenosine dehydratase [uncultured Oscillibacter sp.]